MNQDERLIEPPPEEAPLAVATSSSRRRLLRGGIGAAPVLMTLASRPVMATTCVTASIAVSANASRVVGNQTPCHGRGPAQWCSTTPWPLPETKLFKDCFSPTIFEQSKTLKQVMQGASPLYRRSDAEVALARNVCAALLNYHQGYTSAEVLSIQQIKNAWTLGRENRYPVAGVGNWSAVSVNAWLTKMWS